MTTVDSPGVPFVKGHGTGNDFVVLPDLDGALDPSDAQVRAVCDRHRGVGGDGVLRVVPTSVAARTEPALAEQAEAAPWFMDYRNADGSRAEMCGNGVRVFARYLVEAGLAGAGTLPVATRSGVRLLTVPDGDGDISADMGIATTLRIRLLPLVRVGDTTWPGFGVHLPNPHCVVHLEHLEELDALDLSEPPDVQAGPAFPDGVNVEFVVPVGPRNVRMRVHERGVGETLSCGTGACAVMVAAAARDQAPLEVEYVVDVPGGTVRVRRSADEHLHLSGPAVLVARGTIDLGWWQERA